MKAIISKYHALLEAEESLANLDAALALVERVARRVGFSEPMRATARGSGSGRKGNVRLERTIDALTKVGARVASESHLSGGDYSLLMDLLILVFHQALFALLPGLSKNVSQRRLLLAAFNKFTATMQRDSDRFQMLGLTEYAAGEGSRGIEHLRSALAATHSDDHEFVSRLQLLWNFLIERGLFKEAFGLLREQYPRVSRENLEEVGLLMQTTFELGLSRRQHPRIAS